MFSHEESSASTRRVGATAHGRGTSTFPALFFDGTTHDTNIMLAGVDKGFLAEQRARAEQRAARFAREAQQGPPPLPTNRLTVSEGKVNKPRDEADVMSAFIRRKLATGAALNDTILSKAQKLGISVERLAEEEVAEETASSDNAADSPAKRVGTANDVKKRGGRHAHGSLDDDLDDYFRAAASPPKRATPSVSRVQAHGVAQAAAPDKGEKQKPQKPQKQQEQERAKLTKKQEQKLRRLKQQWQADEAAEAAAEAARPPPPAAASSAHAAGSGTDDLTEEQARVVAETIKMLMAGADGATKSPGTAADSSRRGKARFGGLSGRWRLAFMLMRTKRNLRTSATRAFFFPKMSRRGRITHRPSR